MNSPDNILEESVNEERDFEIFEMWEDGKQCHLDHRRTKREYTDVINMHKKIRETLEVIANDKDFYD